jgi:hypothetical protein
MISSLSAHLTGQTSAVNEETPLLGHYLKRQELVKLILL